MADPRAELETLAQRLQKLRGSLAEVIAKAEAAGELLSRERTFPRPRREVEEELRTAAEFDIPMLTEEIRQAELEIATKERTLGITPEGSRTGEPSPEMTSRARCAVIGDALTALQRRAVYTRELASSAEAGSLDTTSLGVERSRAEQGVTEIEAHLTEVERVIAATKADLREIVIQRAPGHSVQSMRVVKAPWET